MTISRCTICLILSLTLVTTMHGKLLAQDRVPVYLNADNISVNQKNGVSVYRGNVRLKRGTMRVKADNATVRQTGNRILSVDASGSPVVMRRKEPETNRFITVRGQQLVFDASTNIVTVRGNVITTRGRDTLRSDKLIYQIDKNHVIAEHDSPQSPVSADLRPRAETK
jgi:lipopolysaccharide export system protein LptA